MFQNFRVTIRQFTTNALLHKFFKLQLKKIQFEKLNFSPQAYINFQFVAVEITIFIKLLK
jgi:hypothetical protein